MLPHVARLVEASSESADTRTLVLALDPPVASFDAAAPGQFVMLSLLGHGEAAFSLSSLPRAGAADGTVVVTVRRVGRLTAALLDLAPGARVGVRGPFGHGFTTDAPGTATVYVGGGCGLSPLKAAIELQLATRPPRTPIAIVYGARDPETRIHRAALSAWESLPDVHLVECVERAPAAWWGRVGIVTEHVAEAAAAIGAGRAALCGPPAMLVATARRLVAAGLPPAAVHVALERYMKCGIGRCGHCYVNHRYACTDGPVFTFAELLRLPDAFAAESATGAAD